MPPALFRWALYRQAVVHLQTAGGMMTVRASPGGGAWAFPDVQGRMVRIVTAFNPAGRTAHAADNAGAQAGLWRNYGGGACPGGPPKWCRRPAPY